MNEDGQVYFDEPFLVPTEDSQRLKRALEAERFSFPSPEMVLNLVEAQARENRERIERDARLLGVTYAWADGTRIDPLTVTDFEEMQAESLARLGFTPHG